MIVLDASVGVKWFLREAETETAMKLLDVLAAGQEVAAIPELFYYEVFAVVARKHENPGLWAKEGWPWLLDLPLRRVPVYAELGLAMQQFAAQGLSGYDASYAALASLHNGRWITFDRRASALLGDPDWIVPPEAFLK